MATLEGGKRTKPRINVKGVTRPWHPDVCALGDEGTPKL